MTMVWYPANVVERAMAWSLAVGDYARFFRAFARGDLFLPRRSVTGAHGEEPRPVTVEAYGWTVLPVFTSDEGMLAALDRAADVVEVTTYEHLRNDWPGPEWRLAINPGLPIEAYLPVEAVERGMRGELLPRYDQEIIIRPLGDGTWQPWPPGGANQALLDAVSRGDGWEYLDALLDSTVAVPTGRRVDEGELQDLVRTALHRPGPGPLDDRARHLLSRAGVPAEALDRTFPWRISTSAPEPTVEVFTDAEFLADALPHSPSVTMKFTTMLQLLPAEHALSVNPGGPAGLDLPSDQVPLLARWESIEPVPPGVQLGMRWAGENPIRILER